MRVYGIQLDIRWEDKPANLARVWELVRGAGVLPGSLIVLPEMFSTGFSMSVPRVAEDERGVVDHFLAELAVETESTVVGGMVTRQEDGRGLNVAAVVGPDGVERVRYVKMHPFSYAGEDRHYAAGDRVVTFGWGGFEVAPLICYDLRFPEVYREAVRRGAQVLVTIASFPASREHHWVTLNTARAIENQAYVVAVNRCGSDPNASYSGRSLVLDPRGQVLADAGTREGVVAADLDLASLREYRGRFPALADMRADLLPGTADTTGVTLKV